MDNFRNPLTKLNISILFILIAIALGTAFMSSGFKGTNKDDWWESWFQNFSTEMLGAAVTFILIEIVLGENQRRLERTISEKELKDRLIDELSSTINELSRRAAEKIRNRGWHLDGTLKGINLRHANLKQVYLSEANLRNTRMNDCNLSEANLGYADLRDADLSNSNLSNARLHFSKLHGTYLLGANLQGAIIDNASLNEQTILPDGTSWTVQTDMARFIDPTHPEFWQPDLNIA